MVCGFLFWWWLGFGVIVYWPLTLGLLGFRCGDGGFSVVLGFTGLVRVSWLPSRFEVGFTLCLCTWWFVLTSIFEFTGVGWFVARWVGLAVVFLVVFRGVGFLCFGCLGLVVLVLCLSDSVPDRVV